MLLASNRDERMGDITSTSFGLVIAFLLPGLAVLYGLTFWSENAKKTYQSLLSAQSNVGLFLLVMLAGVAVGLMLTLVRWLVFEFLLCKEHLDTANFKNLHQKERLDAFRAAADEHYRYHQFWGGMALALPVIAIGWLKQLWDGVGLSTFILATIGIVGVEILTVCGATAAYKNYVRRGNLIMKS